MPQHMRTHMCTRKHTRQSPHSWCPPQKARRSLEGARNVGSVLKARGRGSAGLTPYSSGSSPRALQTGPQPGPASSGACGPKGHFGLSPLLAGMERQAWNPAGTCTSLFGRPLHRGKGKLWKAGSRAHPGGRILAPNGSWDGKGCVEPSPRVLPQPDTQCRLQFQSRGAWSPLRPRLTGSREWGPRRQASLDRHMHLLPEASGLCGPPPGRPPCPPH